MTILEDVAVSSEQIEISRLVLAADAIARARTAADQADVAAAQALVVKALSQLGSAKIPYREKRRVITALFESSKAPSDIAMAGKLAEADMLLSNIAPLLIDAACRRSSESTGS